MTPDTQALMEANERRARGRVEVKHAAGNFPNKGRRLKYGLEAARALDALAERNDLKVVSIAESYTAHRLAFRQNKALRKQWRTIASGPNSILPWGKVGNAMIVSRDLRLVRKINLRVKYKGHPLGLNMPIATLQTDEGWRLTECAAHLPTTRAVSEPEWERQLRKVRRSVMDQARTHGADVAVISMDSNRGAARVKEVLGEHWQCWADDDVMQVWVNKLGTRVVKGKSGVIKKGYDEVLSDHDGLPWVEVVFTP